MRARSYASLRVERIFCPDRRSLRGAQRFWAQSSATSSPISSAVSRYEPAYRGRTMPAMGANYLWLLQGFNRSPRVDPLRAVNRGSLTYTHPPWVPVPRRVEDPHGAKSRGASHPAPQHFAPMRQMIAHDPKPKTEVGLQTKRPRERKSTRQYVGVKMSEVH